ncbi:hypothetical protein [Marivirga harenae]|uniref:hypothetical protein n=1 Tax=Marivirga harenae TaxID=2010992 RepID=UPI0026E07427|nr:hypothetical protein [Marivirga harenae]WKV13165.1 hypothetical protein Q3Y49_04905 [Marivirga harenae]|tara:strand:- start:326633 stop:326848 length:216 start_codon:yes stop_codon:yes gene_type:complete
MSKNKEANKKDKKPSVNPKLEGFDVKIDSFGEIQTSFDIDRINQFLNKEVEDKKLKDRDDIEGLKNRDEEE